jgi:hypothetical protein
MPIKKLKKAPGRTRGIEEGNGSEEVASWQSPVSSRSQKWLPISWVRDSSGVWEMCKGFEKIMGKR